MSNNADDPENGSLVAVALISAFIFSSEHSLVVYAFYLAPLFFF